MPRLFEPTEEREREERERPERTNGAPSTSGVSRLFAPDSREQNARLSTSIRSGSQKDPDQQGQILQLQARTGLPADLIERNYDTIRERVDRPEFNAREFRENSPIVARWLEENPQHGGVAHDDLEPLTGLEGVLKAPFRAFQSSAEPATDVPRAFLSAPFQLGGRFSRGLLDTVQDVRDAVGLPSHADIMLQGVSPEAREQLEPMLDPVAGAERVAGAVEEFGRDIAPPEERQNYATDVAQVVGEMMTQVAITIGTGPVGFGTTMVGLGADVQDQRIADRDIGAGREALTQIAGGTVTSVMERWGIDKLLDRVPSQARNRFAGQLKDLFMAGGIETVQEVPEGIAQNMLSMTFDPSQPLLGGAWEDAKLAFGGGSVSRLLLNLAMPNRRAMQARVDRDRLQTFTERANEARLRERAPEEFERLVREMAGEDQRYIYAPVESWDTLFQDDPRGRAEELLGSADSYNEASNTGGFIEIPVEKYARNIAPMPESADLLNDLKFDPEGMSFREAEEFEQLKPELVREFLQEAAPDQEVTDDSDAVFETVRSQLTEAGVEDSAAADQARQMQSVFRTLGQRTGINPKSLFDRFGLEVGREGIESPQMERGFFQRLANRFLRPSAPVQAAPQIRVEEAGDTRTYQTGAAQASVSESEGVLRVDSVEVDPTETGRGRERALIERVILDAAQDGQRVESAETVTDTERRAWESLAESGYDVRTRQGDTGPMFHVEPPSVSGEGTFTLDDQPVSADPDTAEGLAIRSLGRPDAFPLDDVLRPFEEAGQQDFAEAARRAVLNLEGRVGFRRTLPGDQPSTTVEGIEVEDVSDDPEIQRIAAQYYGDQGGPESIAEGRRTAAGTQPDPAWVSETRVRDERGQPAVIHRGGRNELSPRHFERESLGQNTGYNASGLGVWMTTDPDDAASYGAVQSYQVDIRNPAVFVAGGGNQDVPIFESIEEAYQFREDLRAQGHDGIVVDLSEVGRGKHVVAFEPEQVIEAQPTTLEQRRDTEKRGQIQFNATRSKFKISLMENADLSTFLHESGHFYLEVLRDLSEQGETTPQMDQDITTLLDWMGVNNLSEISTAQHEQFARGFEAYLMEGKAPSTSLREAFNRFRVWLVGVYESIKELKVTLTPEVRGVFDRLLATDAEIDAAEQAQSYSDAIFQSAEEAGWTEEQFQDYQEKKAEAQREADEEITREAMDEVQREQKKWWNERRRIVKEAVEIEINARRDYQALAYLQRGIWPDGSQDQGQRVKISKDALVDEYGEGFLKRLPKPFIYTREGGVHPDTIAPMFGYRSGDALMQDLADLPPRGRMIEAETDRRMREEYGDIRTDGTLAEKAMRAIHNDKRLDLMLAEQRALDRLTGRRRAPSQKQVIKAAAQDMIRAKTIRDLKPNVYRVAEAKAGREALNAAGRQDWDAVSRAKSRQMLNHELYREAHRARDRSEANVKFLRQFNKKTRRTKIAEAGGDYLDQIDQQLAKIELRNVPLRELDKRESLAEFLRRKETEVQPIERPTYAEEGLSAVEDAVDSRGNSLEALRNEAETTNWKQLTVEELEGVRDNVNVVWHLSKLKNRMLTDHRIKELNELAAFTGESIREKANREVPQERLFALPKNMRKLGRAELGAMSRRIPSFVLEMDGGSYGGPMFEAFLKQLNLATNRESAMTQKFSNDFAELLNKHYSKFEQRRMLNKTFFVPGVESEWNKDALLAVTLNWGNPKNRQRLMDGEKLSEAQIETLMSRLDARDFQFVQDMWDYIDTYWADFAENHKALFGLPPEKVTGDVDPLLRRMAERHGVELRGGYYPIAFDSTRSMVTADRALEQERQRFNRPTNRTEARSAKARSEADVAIPIKLSMMTVVPNHIKDTIHHIAFDQPILDSARVLNHREVREAIVQHYGKPVFDQFNRLLVDVKFGTEPAKNWWERFITRIRNGASIAGMGFSVTTTALQPLGLSNSVSVLGNGMRGSGAFWLSKGVARMGSGAVDNENAARWAVSQSQFLEFRRLNPNREIGDIMNRFKGQGWRSKLDAAAFWTIANVQFFAVDLPTWYAGYEKAKDAGFEHDDAVLIADQTVRDSQGGGDLLDQTAFQRGGPHMKLFTNFMSYMSTTYSIQAQKFRQADLTDPVDLAGLAKDHLLLAVVPAAGATVLSMAYEAFTGGEPEDEPEDIAISLAREYAGMLVGGIVGAREFSGFVRGFHQYDGPAGLTFFGDSISAGQQAMQGEIDEAFIRSMIRPVSVYYSLPGVQIDRAYRGGKALLEGDSDNPAVLLLGPPRDD